MNEKTLDTQHGHFRLVKGLRPGNTVVNLFIWGLAMVIIGYITSNTSKPIKTQIIAYRSSVSYDNARNKN